LRADLLALLRAGPALAAAPAAEDSAGRAQQQPQPQQPQQQGTAALRALDGDLRWVC
jgi:hypothetical protein